MQLVVIRIPDAEIDLESLLEGMLSSGVIFVTSTSGISPFINQETQPERVASVTMKSRSFERRMSTSYRNIHRKPSTVVDCKGCVAAPTDSRGGSSL